MICAWPQPHDFVRPFRRLAPRISLSSPHVHRHIHLAWPSLAVSPSSNTRRRPNVRPVISTIGLPISVLNPFLARYLRCLGVGSVSEFRVRLEYLSRLLEL